VIAADARVDTGDTAWVLAAAALVMFMTPGLAFFYGGLVRTKNVLATIMYSFAALALVTVVWTLMGHTLAFGPDVGAVVGQGGWIGGVDFVGFREVGAEPHPLAPTILQLAFAIITPALISGAFAERMRFSGYLVFTALWTILVYAPLAHWVWGGGFLGPQGIGALDFAGGTVVHLNAGVAALVVGARRGWPRPVLPHNVPFVVLGASILWFGWFGFNAGSALSAGSLAASAFVATQLATAAAVFGWVRPAWIRLGRPTTVGAATGAVAGLVAITPASGFVRPWAALLIGLPPVLSASSPLVSSTGCATTMRWTWSPSMGSVARSARYSPASCHHRREPGRRPGTAVRQPLAGGPAGGRGGGDAAVVVPGEPRHPQAARAGHGLAGQRGGRGRGPGLLPARRGRLHPGGIRRRGHAIAGSASRTHSHSRARARSHLRSGYPAASGSPDLLLQEPQRGHASLAGVPGPRPGRRAERPARRVARTPAR
jgi:Amt family ammonium transporter